MAPGFSAGAIACGDRAGRADRHRDDDEIGVPHRLGRVGRVAVAEPELVGARCSVAALRRGDGDVAGQPFAAHDAGDRRADEADADEGDLVKQRFAAWRQLSRNSASAATTPRLASSVPTVMRSALGKP